MNKRLARKIAKSSAPQNGVESALVQDVAVLAQSVPLIRHAVEEVAEDNMALMRSVSRIADGQETQRAVLLQEIGQLRAAVAGELIAQSLKACCRELSPVVNALEGMLDLADFSDAAVTRQHIESLATTLRGALGRLGIERIPVALGIDLFDSHLHECIGVCTAVDSPMPSAPTHTIVRVVEPGYRINGRVALPTKVLVQKLGAEDINAGKEEAV